MTFGSALMWAFANAGSVRTSFDRSPADVELILPPFGKRVTTPLAEFLHAAEISVVLD